MRCPVRYRSQELFQWKFAFPQFRQFTRKSLYSQLGLPHCAMNLLRQAMNPAEVSSEANSKCTVTNRLMWALTRVGFNVTKFEVNRATLHSEHPHLRWQWKYIYSGTSEKGPSQKRTTSQERTLVWVPFP